MNLSEDVNCSLDAFALTVETQGLAAVVWVRGELDIATAPELRECLARLDGQPMTLDLSGVTFMDSGGLAILAWATKRAHECGAELNVRGVRPAQMRVLEITGLADQLNLDADCHAMVVEDRGRIGAERGFEPSGSGQGT
jgi:anti-sigma B factor antagonist